MDAPVKVSHHKPLKSLVLFLFAAFAFLLGDGFVLREEPTWSHWGLLFMGTPLSLAILCITWFSFIEVNQRGIEKKWNLFGKHVLRTYIPWPDVTQVTPYWEDNYHHKRSDSESRQTGIMYTSKTGAHIRIPHSIGRCKRGF